MSASQRVDISNGKTDEALLERIAQYLKGHIEYDLTGTVIKIRKGNKLIELHFFALNTAPEINYFGVYGSDDENSGHAMIMEPEWILFTGATFMTGNPDWASGKDVPFWNKERTNEIIIGNKQGRLEISEEATFFSAIS